jgi:hypothetical protein
MRDNLLLERLIAGFSMLRIAVIGVTPRPCCPVLGLASERESRQP